MNSADVLKHLGKNVRVTYDVGTKEHPHHVSQKGVLVDLMGNATEPSTEKIYLTVMGKVRDGTEAKVPHTSWSMLRYPDIVSVEEIQ
jgi:hypothetical protein